MPLSPSRLPPDHPILLKPWASDPTNSALLTATPMNLLSPWRKIIPYLLAERYPPSNLRFDCFKDHRGSICQKRPRWTWRNYAGTMETKIVSYASYLLITFARDCANMVVNTTRPFSLLEKHVSLRVRAPSWEKKSTISCYPQSQLINSGMFCI